MSRIFRTRERGRGWGGGGGRGRKFGSVCAGRFELWKPLFYFRPKCAILFLHYFKPDPNFIPQGLPGNLDRCVPAASVLFHEFSSWYFLLTKMVAGLLSHLKLQFYPSENNRHSFYLYLTKHSRWKCTNENASRITIHRADILTGTSGLVPLESRA